MVEELGGFFGLALGNQHLGAVFYFGDFVEGFLLEAVGGAKEGLLGAAPLHSGELVGLAVMPNPGFFTVAQLSALVEAIG